ncbi:MAG: hypothetical protein EAZ89_19300 [Bacteroidetes bacterium]|nr:MAG: hypothetical protein EAZ89_19300 [Bacteroidota bacterium]
MNPAEKGWLKKFITFRKRVLRGEPPSPTLDHLLNKNGGQQYLYHLVQPTGLVYGHCIRFVEQAHPRTSDWTDNERMKVLLADAYLMCGLYFHFESVKDLHKSFQLVTQDIRDFYEQHFALVTDSPRYLFGRTKTPPEQVEYIFDRRISIRYDGSNFWSSFFHNSLLYFDLILFVQWKENPVIFSEEQIRSRHEEIHLTLLQVIAAAAHADGVVLPEERAVFTYFLQSARLSVAQKRKAARFLSQGVTLESLNLEHASAWIMRKYLLELAILTALSSRQIAEESQRFLSQLALRLELSENDLEKSRTSVEHFILTYWNEVHYLQLRQNYLILSDRLILRMRYLVKKNSQMVALEIQESRELVYLLRKSTTQELTSEEKEKVRNQLLDILRSIPAFTLLMLPGAFITLPILFRIIPKSVLYPSSFLPPKDEEDEEEEALKTKA